MRDTIDMAREVKMPYDFVTGEPIYLEKLKAFEALVRADERNRTWTQEHWTEYERSIAAAEREACLALHQHEDVLAPVGASSWGEAYQEGWAKGTAAYHAAIRARGNT